MSGYALCKSMHPVHARALKRLAKEKALNADQKNPRSLAGLDSEGNFSELKTRTVSAQGITIHHSSRYGNRFVCELGCRLRDYLVHALHRFK